MGAMAQPPEPDPRYTPLELEQALYALLMDVEAVRKVELAASRLSKTYGITVDPSEVIRIELEWIKSGRHQTPLKSAPVAACLYQWMKKWAYESGRVSSTDARRKLVSIHRPSKEGRTFDQNLPASDDPEKELCYQQFETALMAARAALGRDLVVNEVIRLRLEGIEKPAEIARSIGCPVAKVYKAIQKIRVTLDKLLPARGEAQSEG
jgi:hypothetical protein